MRRSAAITVVMKVYLTAFVCGAALLVSALPGSADLRECRGVATAGYKVLLDDIPPLGAEPPPAELKRFMKELEFKVSTTLEQLGLEAGPGIRLVVVRCENRQPEGEGDFSKRLVDGLNAQDVVLELWGNTNGGTDEQGKRYHEAFIGYALIPVRFYEFDSGDPAGVYTVRHRKEVTASTGEVLDLFAQATELSAYAAIGVGTKSMKVHDYDRALQYLCKSELLLKQAGTAPGASQGSLLNYVRRLAVETVAKARQDPTYTGAIKLLSTPQASAPCTGGK